MEGSKPKKNKKRTIIISIVSIITILIIGTYIYNKINMTKEEKINYLLAYKKNHTAEETHQKLDKMFDINSSENDEVYNIVFADEIQSTKKVLAEVKERKKNEEEYNKRNSEDNIKIEDLRQIPNKQEIEFKIINPTNRNIRYMEMLINYHDGNKNIISSDWTNESNIPANTNRVKQAYVSFPNGTKGITVQVSKVEFEN